MPLDPVTPSTFYTPLDAGSSLSIAHTIGQTTLNVVDASGFGAGAVNLRLTGQRGAGGPRVHFHCTLVAGNVLTVTLMDGYADIALIVGDLIEQRDSAEDMVDVQSPILACQGAINQHAAGAAALDGASFTGQVLVTTAGTHSLQAFTDTANAIQGTSVSGNGTSGYSTSGYGVRGVSTSGRAASFDQQGTFTASTAEPTVRVKRQPNLNGFDATGATLHVEDSTAATGPLITVIKANVTIFTVSAAGVLTCNGSGLTNLTGANVSGNIPGFAAGISANIVESQVTGLTGDLASKATLASPSFTGTVTVGTLAGLIKGTVGALSAASPGVDYVAPGTVTAFTAQQNFAGTTLVDGASVAWDLSANQATEWTMTGNHTLANPTNIKNLGTYILRIVQGGSGSNLPTFSSAYKFPGGVVPMLSTALGAVDYITFIGRGTTILDGVCVKAMG